MKHLPHHVAIEAIRHLSTNLYQQPFALLGDTVEAELKKGCEIVILGPNFRERLMVRYLFVVVVVGHRYKQIVLELRMLQDKSLQRARRSTVTVMKWMHGANVMMQH